MTINYIDLSKTVALEKENGIQEDVEETLEYG